VTISRPLHPQLLSLLQHRSIIGLTIKNALRSATIPPLRVSNGAEVDVRCVDGNAVVVNDDLVWPYADDLVSVIGFDAKEGSRDSVITVWKDNIV
jgi:hypothetical protein